MHQRIALTVLFFLLVSACSHSADVHLQNGERVRGELVAGDATSLTVVSDDHQTHQISRDEIENIDHPGNVGMIIGYSVAGGAAATSVFAIDLMVVSDGEYDENDTSDAAGVDGVIGFGLLMLSAPFLVGGLAYGIYETVTWTGSRGVADSRDDGAAWFITPAAYSSGDELHYGVGAGCVF